MKGSQLSVGLSTSLGHSSLLFPSKCPCRPGQGYHLPQEIVLGLHLLEQALKKRDDQRSQLRRSKTRNEGVSGTHHEELFGLDGVLHQLYHLLVLLQLVELQELALFIK